MESMEKLLNRSILYVLFLIFLKIYLIKLFIHFEYHHIVRLKNEELFI